MKVWELVDAIAVDVGAESMDPDCKLNEPEDILHICGGLVDLNRWNMTLGLAHFTVKEYLMSTNITQGPAAAYQIQPHTANTELTKICLTYILFNDFSTGPCYTEDEFLARLNEYPLLRYAPYYWPNHIRKYEIGSNGILDDLVLSFFRLGQDSGSFLSWWQIYHAGGDNKYSYPKGEPKTLLYLAAEMGQYPAAIELLEGGANINAECGNLGTPLLVAAEEGHLETVRVLLEKGVGLLEKGKEKYRPLHKPMTEASRHGFVKCVQLLLDYGDEETSDWANCCREAISVLPIEVPEERENIMEIFLATEHFRRVPTAEEADVPVSSMPDFLEAFMCCVCFGWEKSSRSMFKIGSDIIVSAINGTFLEMCLHYIIMYGHLKLLKMIMQNENARNLYNKHHKHQAHLQKAAYYEQDKIVEFLLRLNGASGIEGVGISLHIAAAKGHIGIMERLLRAGADPQQEDYDGWSPLAYASQYHKNLAIEKLSALTSCPEALDIGVGPISRNSSLKPLEAESIGRDKLISYNLSIWLTNRGLYIYSWGKSTPNNPPLRQLFL